MTVAQLDELCQQVLDQLHADIDAYDERTALQAESRAAEIGNKTTTDFAIEALQRTERFCGERDVARAWLRTNDPHVRIFRRVSR